MSLIPYVISLFLGIGPVWHMVGYCHNNVNVKKKTALAWFEPVSATPFHVLFWVILGYFGQTLFLPATRSRHPFPPPVPVPQSPHPPPHPP